MLHHNKLLKLNCLLFKTVGIGNQQGLKDLNFRNSDSNSEEKLLSVYTRLLDANIQWYK